MSLRPHRPVLLQEVQGRPQARLPSFQALPAVAFDGDTRCSAFHADGAQNSQEPVGYLLEAPGEGSAPSAYP